jgi:hypothetical protein
MVPGWWKGESESKGKGNSRSLRDDNQKGIGNGSSKSNSNSRSLRDDNQKGKSKGKCSGYFLRSGVTSFSTLRATCLLPLAVAWVASSCMSPGMP